MRRLALLPILAALAAMPAPADAHRERFWWAYTPVPAADARRVANLGRRTAALAVRLPDPSRPAYDLIAAGQCRAAEPLLRPGSFPLLGRIRLAAGAVGANDAACAGRLIGDPFAEPPAAGAELEQALALHDAGALLRRIGNEENGFAAFREAERRIHAYKLADPDWDSRCHAGCQDPYLWARSRALRIYHGSPLFALEIDRLAREAIEHVTPRREDFELFARARGTIRHLLEIAGQENDSALLARLAPHGDNSEAAFWTARMHAAFDEGHIAEAVSLRPRAPFFTGNFTEDHLREAPLAFHALRTTIRAYLGDLATNELRASLAAIWLERGDIVRTREAWASADADRRAGGAGWFNIPAARLDAVELMLNEAAPVAALSRRRFDDGSSRDYAFRELALLLAATGRWAEFDVAAAQYSHDRDRAWMIARLPCTAARAGNERAVAGALARARAQGEPPLSYPSAHREQELDDLHWQNAGCLLRYGFTETAIAYVSANNTPAKAVSSLSHLTRAVPPASRQAQRRRLALAAFQLVERNRLWSAAETAALAEQLERAGEHRRVDRLLARAGSDTLRIDIYRGTLAAYRGEI